jgi:hypothetical protein
LLDIVASAGEQHGERHGEQHAILRGHELAEGTWFVRQVLDDADGDHDWAITAVVDLAASDAAGEVVLAILGIGPM